MNELFHDGWWDAVGDHGIYQQRAHRRQNHWPLPQGWVGCHGSELSCSLAVMIVGLTCCDAACDTACAYDAHCTVSLEMKKSPQEVSKHPRPHEFVALAGREKFAFSQGKPAVDGGLYTSSFVWRRFSQIIWTICGRDLKSMGDPQ